VRVLPVPVGSVTRTCSPRAMTCQAAACTTGLDCTTVGLHAPCLAGRCDDTVTAHLLADGGTKDLTYKQVEDAEFPMAGGLGVLVGDADLPSDVS